MELNCIRIGFFSNDNVLYSATLVCDGTSTEQHHGCHCQHLSINHRFCNIKKDTSFVLFGTLHFSFSKLCDM